jgi:hypothetical protein
MLYPVIPLGFLLALIAVLLGYPDAAACIIMLLWFGWLLAIIFRDAIRLQEKSHKDSARNTALMFLAVCGLTVWVFDSGIVAFDWAQVPFNFFLVALGISVILLACVFALAMLSLLVGFKIRSFKRRL